eukprot:tig00000459_g1085.t1
MAPYAYAPEPLNPHEHLHSAALPALPPRPRLDPAARAPAPARPLFRQAQRPSEFSSLLAAELQMEAIARRVLPEARELQSVNIICLGDGCEMAVLQALSREPREVPIEHLGPASVVHRAFASGLTNVACMPSGALATDATREEFRLRLRGLVRWNSALRPAPWYARALGRAFDRDFAFGSYAEATHAVVLSSLEVASVGTIIQLCESAGVPLLIVEHFEGPATLAEALQRQVKDAVCDHYRDCFVALRAFVCKAD